MKDIKVRAGTLLGLVSCLLAAQACLLGSQNAPQGNPGSTPVVATQKATNAAQPSLPPSPSPTANPAATASGPTPPDKFSLWVGGPHLRGANIYQRRVYPELDGNEFLGPGPLGPPYTQEDFNRLAAVGANYVNISHPGLFSEQPPYALDPAVQENLDRLIRMAETADLFAVISFRTGPGRSEFTFFAGEEGWFDQSYVNNRVWQDEAAQAAWAELWGYTAQHYRSNPVVVGYDLMVEPNSSLTGSFPDEPRLEIWDPQEFSGRFAGSLYDWNQLYPHIVAAIRAVDPDTPVLVGGNGYSGLKWLDFLVTSSDPLIVYTFHQYEPFRYTHQPAGENGCTYPGHCDVDEDGAPDTFNRQWLESQLSAASRFNKQHAVPLAVNEFGAMRWQPGAANFLDDELDLFEKLGFNHAIWQWMAAWPPLAQGDNEFNYRLGEDPQNLAEIPDNPLLAVLSKYWSRNSIRPSTFKVASSPDSGPGSSTLAPLPVPSVQTWAYQIQGLDAPGAIELLADSSYDLLVVEPTRTDWSGSTRDFDTGAMVARLKNSLADDGVHRKIVLAYIDIGQAEDWRWYWRWSTGWNCRSRMPSGWPDFILTCDPDGWAGDYPVAYWDTRWKDIVLHGDHTAGDDGYASMIGEVLADGFDGVYLDWVEAFENEAVIDAAQRVGVDPQAEMVQLIREIRAKGQAANPGFIVIQQNGAALSQNHPEIYDLVDAIAQEGIWYEGDATDDWDDPQGYDWQVDPQLTAEYFPLLNGYQAAGVPVLDCEYALEHAGEVYRDSRQRGYIPYVTRRSLSRLTTTAPPWLP